MKTVRVEDLVVGSIIVEPITYNGVLLCKEGTPVSRSVKSALQKFGIETATVDTVFTERVDDIITDFKRLNQLSCFAMKAMSIDEVILCAKALVSSLLDDEFEKILSVLYNHDVDTYQHSKNVAALSLSCGIKLGMKKSELQDLALGALLHDLGKSVIPTSILNKEGKLSDDELHLMRQHPLIGFSLAQESGLVSTPVLQIIAQHHENYDGTGYPKKLYRSKSYRSARLVHICDVYDAMTAKRSYKDPVSREVVREMLRKESGKMFDPSLLKLFLNTIPLYFVGEEVLVDGKVGIVTDNSNPMNPIIFYNDKLLPYSFFVEDCKREINPDILYLIS